MNTIEFFEQRKKDNFLLLRIIAACMVIYGHSIPLTKDIGSIDIFLKLNFGAYSGEIAVLMFFVISGFMVSGSFIKRNNLVDYLTARVLRIVPALIAVLVITAFIVGPLLTSFSLSEYFNSTSLYQYIYKNLSFSSNLAWVLPGVFEDNRMHSMNGSIWSLSAEMRMYLFVAAIGLFGILSNRISFSILFLLCLLFGYLNPQVFPLHDGWLKPCGFFCLGIMIQLYKNKIQISNQIMLALIFVTYVSRLTDTYPYLFAITLGYFCFWFAYKTQYVNISKYGDPSYGIYLWGWPIQQILVARFSDITPFQNFILSTIFACGIGYLSWHLLEKRAIGLGTRTLRIK